ncbi:hypothetical protein CRUP_022034, partial [Coryphaenoides rupestris]
MLSHSVRPARALIDEQISIQGRFLPARSPVTVHAHMHSEEGDPWEAFGHYNTDENGVVNCPGPFPALVDLWGMGGGLHEYRSALFASKGVASLSLAYFAHKDIPGPPNKVNVGDDYFRTAYKLLQDHPDVCEDRIGLIGLSYGVYLVLRMATHMGVKLEALECPLMYIVAEDDYSCASVETANEIEETLRAVGKAALFTRLSYPDAGHLIEPPYAPNTRVSLWTVKPNKINVIWGGHPAPHAAAQEDAWKKMLDFIEDNLR